METVLTQTQVEDSMAALETAVDSAFSASDRETGYYQPDREQVPRPAYALFAGAADAYAERHKQKLTKQQAGLILQPEQTPVLENFAGLRAVAKITISGKTRTAEVDMPAIVLEGGRQLAVLMERHGTECLSDLQQLLLETEYTKHLSDVTAEHDHGDVVNAGAIAPALVVASSLQSARAHHEMHGLASGTDEARGIKTFGKNFSRSGRQDIMVSGTTRSVVSNIVSIADVVELKINDNDQLPSERQLLNVQLSATEQAIAQTLTATESRHNQLPDLKNNLSSMVGG